MMLRSILCGAALILSALQPAASASLPTGARSMPPSDVRRIYSGATWNWKELSTGIYFAPSGELVAFERSRHERYGAGRWSVDAGGRLCVSIRWERRIGAVSHSNSCWDHRQAGGDIWKQNSRRAKWYSLRGPSNELGRILRGNRLERI